MSIDLQRYEELSELLKALAHPVRLCIVRGLLAKGECNVTHMQSCLDAPQSTVSQHLQKLKAAGIISGNRSGLEINYRIKDPRIAPLIELLLAKETEGGF